MQKMKTNEQPMLETDRLLLRSFCKDDIPAIFKIYSDEEVNTFLPWYHLKTMEEAAKYYEEHYANVNRMTKGYQYAICLKSDHIPIGYMHVDQDTSHDFGYGLLKEFWHNGIVTEAGRAVIEQLKKDGVPYITATHDVLNPRSGAVMQKLGMRYQYSYEEFWQPKNFPVIFRMYQLNFDGNEDRVFTKYWDQATIRFVETIKADKDDERQ